MKQYCVIGANVNGSLSPQIYNWLFDKYNVDASYGRRNVPITGLLDFVDEAAGLAGFNVTMPYKLSIMPFLDAVGSSARESGSVNTVVNDGGRLIGHSTDAEGFEQALHRNGVEVRGKRVMVLGAGGAALAVVNALEGLEATDVVIHSRNSRSPIASLNFQPETLKKTAQNANLIVNCTPLGQTEGEQFESLDFLNGFEGAVFDLIYDPPETELVAAARRRGLLAFGGLGMLAGQALGAFRHFCGINAEDDYEQIERYIYEKHFGN